MCVFPFFPFPSISPHLWSAITGTIRQGSASAVYGLISQVFGCFAVAAAAALVVLIGCFVNQMQCADFFDFFFNCSCLCFGSLKLEFWCSL
jgi:hypothetical protein